MQINIEIPDELIETYEAFFRFEPVKTAINRFQVKLLVYNTEKEEIEQWIE